MMRSLFGKLALVLLLLFGALGAMGIVVTLTSTRLYQEEVAQKLNRSLAQSIAEKRPILRDGEVDQDALEALFDDLMVINPSIELYLLDRQGGIRTYSAPPGKVVRQSVSLDPIRRFIEGSATFPVQGDDPRDTGRRKVFSAAEILGPSGETQGFLYIILGGEEYDSAAQLFEGSYILRLSAAVAIAGLLFAFVAALVLFRFLTRRLRRLTREVDTFRASDFTRPLPPGQARPKGDEIDRLGASFEEMSARIVRQVEQLKRTDEDRRELVANISHDLRTPLAALQGYIETLQLKQSTLTDLERARYLETAAAHSNKLGTLIAQLFELSRLEANEAVPQLERCSMAELVQDVVQRFHMQAERKGVRLTADFALDLPEAEVDIRLMERVLQNLIENAIRFTPEGGSVTVSAMQDAGGGIRLQVADTGAGIPEDEIPLVFRRYHVASRTGPSEGTGLGLAIAKKIVELHGSRLEVASRLREGTTFSFHPPVASRG